jgi:hypothetical protein
LIRPGTTVTRGVTLTDAGGGGGIWAAGLSGFAGVSLSVPPQVTVPGTVTLRVVVPRPAPEGDRAGFITLSHGSDQRRIPFWFRIERPRLPTEHRLSLARPGIYRGNTARGVARVSSYRYPAVPPGGSSFPVRLTGPEVVYRVRIPSGAANFGVAVVARNRGIRVEPRIVRDADENRLAGYAALPFDENPYRPSFGSHRLIVGVVLPSPGNYDVVFDTPIGGHSGSFSFRYWVNDVTPPAVRSLGLHGREFEFALSDHGSGVDPSSLHARIDGNVAPVSYSAGLARVSLAGLAKGRHVLSFDAADFQETKNMEDVTKVLPNTRTVQRVVVVP